MTDPYLEKWEMGQVHEYNRNIEMLYCEIRPVGEFFAILAHAYIPKQNYDLGIAAARMMTAAPELLSACKAFESAWANYPNDFQARQLPAQIAFETAIELCKAAIAKAEGKEV